MNVLYVIRRKHEKNDDEGAISHGLESLGNTVHWVQTKEDIDQARRQEWDLVLFNHWIDHGIINYCRNLFTRAPKVLWYFDLVDFPDPTIYNRCRARKTWMKEIIPLVDLMFCTDGDWVQRDTSGKLVRLVQGADIRISAKVRSIDRYIPILFTGIAHGGRGRASFVKEMAERYGTSFHHKGAGVYREDLAKLIGRTRIVVAPDSPVTDYYWSNRVYVSLGFGAFLLHPYCATLESHYVDGQEIVYYRSRSDLHDKIAHYLDRPEERDRISDAGLARTLAHHTYTHRCRSLLEIVKQRLHVG